MVALAPPQRLYFVVTLAEGQGLQHADPCMVVTNKGRLATLIRVFMNACRLALLAPAVCSIQGALSPGRVAAAVLLESLCF